MSFLRPVLGASFGAVRTIPITPPDPAKPPKLDVEVALETVDDEAWTATLNVPAYDLATHNLLAEVRAYLVPKGHGLPSSAADYVASSYPVALADLRENRDGARVILPLPEVDPGDFFGQLVLMFDDSGEPTPTPPSNEPADPPGEPGEPPTTG